MNTSIPILMITGFLGSGKTTFIKQAMKSIPPDRKVGIIQNEFAPGNADVQEIHQSAIGNYQLIELNNGSIFCVCLLGSFLDSLREFSTGYQPDLIIIETSGLSDPIAIGEIFNQSDKQSLFYLKSSITIVDAKHFLQLSQFQKQLQNQIRIADEIILNKTDTIQDCEPALTRIHELNPLAKIHQTSFCEVDWVSILKSNLPQRPKKLTLAPANETPATRPNLQSAAFRSAQPLQRENLTEFLSSISRQSIRAKGILYCDDDNCYSVQSVFGDHNFAPTPINSRKSFIVSISETLSHRNVQQLYDQFV